MLVEQTAYNKEQDKLTTINGSEVNSISEFRESAIQEYTTEEESQPCDQMELYSTRAAASQKTNISDLKSAWPVIYHKVLASKRMQCSALQNQYVTVSAMENRNNYRKQVVDCKAFVAATALTVIAAYIGGPVILAVQVLTVAGVAISAGQTIKDAVTLYKQASYTFDQSWQGYVYDRTSKNCDVLVKRNLKQGVFTGGIDPNGNWTWVMSTIPSNLYTNDELMRVAQSYYNSELMSHNGVNTIFFADPNI